MSSRPRTIQCSSTGALHVVGFRRRLEFIIADLLARLNGDYNPLHASPEVGREMGMGGVIVHGLFTYSSACYGLLRKVCDSDASRLKEFQARFTSPVRPGDKLITQMWCMGMVDGLEEVRFTTSNGAGKTVLGNGRALLLPATIKSVL